MDLNLEAFSLVEEIANKQDFFKCQVHLRPSGARVFDCGAVAPGGIQLGIQLARICLSNLAEVSVSDQQSGGLLVSVVTDHPVLACLGSQYAGWNLKGGSKSALASGPMRLLGSKEKLLDELQLRRPSKHAVGVLEMSSAPPDEMCDVVVRECRVDPVNVAILFARTASLAGTVQIVARCLETALHKMHEIGMPLDVIVSGHGAAPLPPIAKNDLGAMGRTNDAILYGGEVTLWVRAEDTVIESFGPKIPSNSSAMFGGTFAELFQQAGGDFFKLDPLIFSPARIRFINLTSGKCFVFGELRSDIVNRSFAN